MFAFLVKLLVGAAAITSGESAFKDEATRQASYVRAAGMPAAEALVGIIHDGFFSNGVLIAPDLVLTHSHDNWAVGDLVFSPHKGFDTLAFTAHFMKTPAGVTPRFSPDMASTMENAPLGSHTAVTDIICHPHRQLVPILPTKIDFGALRHSRDLPFYDRTAYRAKTATTPIGTDNPREGISGPDLCLLRVQEPFTGITFPTLAAAEDLPTSPIKATVLATHFDTFLSDGSNSSRIGILKKTQSAAAPKALQTKSSLPFPLEIIAFEQSMHAYDYTLVAEARAASKPRLPGVLHEEVFMPGRNSETTAQPGFSGAPVFLEGQLVGITSHVKLTSVTKAIEGAAEQIRPQHPRVAADLDALSPSKTYHPLYNVYSRVDTSATRAWIESVSNSSSLSVPVRGIPDSLEEERY